MDTKRITKEKRFWDRFAWKYDFFVERFIPIYHELITIIVNDLAEGILIAPTYCHGQNIRSRIISRIMGLSGFKAYHKFTIEQFCYFIEGSDFEIVKKQILKGNPPLVYLVAKPLPHI